MEDDYVDCQTKQDEINHYFEEHKISFAKNSKTYEKIKFMKDIQKGIRDIANSFGGEYTKSLKLNKPKDYHLYARTLVDLIRRECGAPFRV